MANDSRVPEEGTTHRDSAELPQPDITRLLDVFGSPFQVRSLAITGLLLLALLYTLYFARELLIPLIGALVLSILLGPVMRGLGRIGLPEPIGAALVLICIIGGLGAGIYLLSNPVSSWTARVPQLTVELSQRFREWREPVEKVQQASEQVENMTTIGNGAAPEVVIKQEPLIQRIAGTLQFVLVQIGVMLLLLYFLLAVGDLFKQKLVRVIPRLSDKKRALVIVREIESQVSSYLLVIVSINVGVGLVVGFGMFLIGIPNPVFFGVLAAVLNFIPFLGPLVGVCVLAVVGVLTFDDVTHAILAPAIYLCVHAFEENLIVPAVVGRRLTLNPVVIVVNVFFWAWLWGIPGALLAGPILITVKVFCDHIEPLAAIGEFLSGPAPSLRDERAQEAAK